MDNKLSNSRKWNRQKFVAKQRFMEKVYETVKDYYIGHGDWSKSDTPNARYQRGPGYDKFFMRKHCTMKYIKEFRTSKMCHKCAWDPKTEKMNEPLLEKSNVKFYGQLERFQYEKVENHAYVDNKLPKEPNLNTFKMINIYDSTKKTKKQLKREQRDKILVESILNKDNVSCSDSELKFKKNKQHNEYRTDLLKKYQVFLRELKLNNDLEFDQTNPSIFDPKTIKQNYQILDAFHLMKNKKQEKHEKKFNSNGMASHRSVLCCKNNIKCKRNVAGNNILIQIFII